MGIQSVETESLATETMTKLPKGDGPYFKAKHAQMIENDSEAAIVWFWRAINEGDRVDSALKDMAVLMKQMERGEEAIEIVKSCRGLCSKNAQESLDNVLIDLYKKCGNVEEQIQLLKRKLKAIYLGEAFCGKPTKAARSKGKKIQISVKQETSKLLANLGWAYMKKSNYMAAEVVYEKAQMIDSNCNNVCNLAECLIRLGRYERARELLGQVLQGRFPGFGCRHGKRAQELLDLGLGLSEAAEMLGVNLNGDGGFGKMPLKSKRLPIFEFLEMSCDNDV